MMEDLIVAQGVGKSFGGNFVVRNVTLSIARGTVHALVGQNGAGKSTLLGMLGGRLRPNEGDVTLDGASMAAASPKSRRQHGIHTVYQELTIVPEMSALENVFLGAWSSRKGRLDYPDMRNRYAELCALFEIDIPARTLAGRLSVAHQQLIEIMRGVGSDARVLLLDEPTAALAEHERKAFAAVVSKLVAAGVTIVVVSHNLDEVLSMSDVVTVLKDGEHVETRPTQGWNRASLIAAMVGRDVSVAERRNLPRAGVLAAQLTSWRRTPDAEPFSLSMHSGEIIGLWGLVGSGRSSFLNSLAGVVRGPRGTLRLASDRAEETSDLPKSPRDAAQRGIGLVHENRKRALNMSMNGSENFWLGRSSASRWGLLRKRWEHREARPILTAFGFDGKRMLSAVGRLSGGNQQKVLLAKWAGRRPSLLLIDEPTRGIDVAAKSEVLDSIVEMATRGTAILVTSSELEEVLAVAHRLLVFAHGNVVQEILPDDPQFTVDEIVKLGFTQKQGLHS